MCYVSPSIYNLLKRKARQSLSTYRISGIAFDKKGDILGISVNSFRNDYVNPQKYSGYHTEKRLIDMYGKRIKTIVLMRIGGGKNAKQKRKNSRDYRNVDGEVLPIQPCEKCQKLCDKLGIVVKSVY